MTERTSQQKQILDKVDSLIEAFNDFKIDTVKEFGEIKSDIAKIQRQPEIDEQQFVNLKEANVSCQKESNTKFKDHDRRISNLEGNQKWVVIVLLGYFLKSIWDIVVK